MKTKGARNVLDRLDALLDADATAAEKIRKLITEAHKLAIYNPPFAKKALEQIEAIEAERAVIRADLRALIKEKIEPYMERANPTTDQRLSDLEARETELEAQVQKLFHLLGQRGPILQVLKGDHDKQRGSSG